MREFAKYVLGIAFVVFAPAAAYAQGSIVGLVKDASGAVLPGVTVEASSPVPGFSTVKREGIELTGAFVARVNADLRVGSIEETVTVIRQTPIVDVQSPTRQRVMDREIVE